MLVVGQFNKTAFIIAILSITLLSAFLPVRTVNASGTLHQVSYSPYWPGSHDGWWLYQYAPIGGAYCQDIIKTSDGIVHDKWKNSNCGIACTAMVINFFKHPEHGPNKVTTDYVGSFSSQYPDVFCHARWNYCQGNGHVGDQLFFDNSDFSYPGCKTEQIQHVLLSEGISSSTYLGSQCQNNGTGLTNLQNSIDQNKLCIVKVVLREYQPGFDWTNWINSNPGWRGKTHWVVVWGYDDDYIYINDPGYNNGAAYASPKSLFAKAMWDMYATSGTHDDPAIIAVNPLIPNFNIERVSVNSNGYQGNGDSMAVFSNVGDPTPAMSSDGRFVAFSSLATNLVSGINDGNLHIYLRDRIANTTSCIDVDIDSNQANGKSYSPSISADGRYITFSSFATNLVKDITNGKQQIYLRDLNDNITTCISVDENGKQGNYGSRFPQISADGNYIAFESAATNLVAGITPYGHRIFLFNLQNHSIIYCSNDLSGMGGISSDGRYICYGSATGTPKAQVYVYDHQTDNVTCMSINPDGINGNADSYYSCISGDGRFVAFQSYATNLLADLSTTKAQIYLRDRQNNTTSCVSVDPNGNPGWDHSYYPSINSDGRFIAFRSASTNLVSGVTDFNYHIYLRDRQASTTQLIDVDGSGNPGNNHCLSPQVNTGGSIIAFNSSATNLVTNDTNGKCDTFVASPAAAPVSTVTDPAVVTNDALGIGGTFATLNGTLTGDGGEVCQFRFCRGTTSGVYTDNTTWSSVYKNSGQSFSDNITTLANGTTYYYIAQCHNSSGIASGSEQSFTTAAQSSPITIIHPSSSETLATGKQFLITWTYKGNLGAKVKIQLYKSGALLSTIANSVSIGSGGSGSYKWTVSANQANASDYTIRVISLSNPSLFGVSTIFTISTPSVAPVLSIPKAGAVITTLMPTLEWSAPNGAATYGLQISTTSNFSSLIYNVTGLTNSIDMLPDRTLSWNKTYYWRVRAFNAQGLDSKWSSSRNFKTAVGPPPNAPANLSTNAVSSTQVSLAWDDNSSNEAGFKIERKTVMGTFDKIKQVGPNVTTYSDTKGLKANTAYTYRVQAYLTSTIASNFSNEATVSTLPPPPSAPTLISPKSGAALTTLITTLDWSEPAGAVKYSLQVSTVNNFATNIIDVSDLSASSYDISSGLEWNKTYYWRVNAVNSSGSFSKWSAMRTFKTKP